MKLVIGENIWDEMDVADIIIVCAGSHCDKMGRLVLNRGQSAHAVDHFKFMPVAFGELLFRKKKSKKVYGFMHHKEIIIPEHKGSTGIGLFQVTDNEHGGINDVIVKESARILKFWSDKWDRIVLEFPWDYGQDEAKDKKILNLLSSLPDNVWVYKEN